MDVKSLQYTKPLNSKKFFNGKARISKTSQINSKEVIYGYLLKHQDSSREELFQELPVGVHQLNNALKELMDHELISPIIINGCIKYHAAIDTRILLPGYIFDATNPKRLDWLAREVCKMIEGGRT